MLPRETVERIRDRYPQTGWAIWHHEFPEWNYVENTTDEVADFTVDGSDKLSTGMIMRGLNRSEDLPTPFLNFILYLEPITTTG